MYEHINNGHMIVIFVDDTEVNDYVDIDEADDEHDDVVELHDVDVIDDEIDEEIVLHDVIEQIADEVDDEVGAVNDEIELHD